MVGDWETGCRRWTAGQETTARISLNKTNFPPLLNGRLVGKSRFSEIRQPSTPVSGAAAGRVAGHGGMVPVVVISQPEPHQKTLQGHAPLRLCGRCQP